MPHTLRKVRRLIPILAVMLVLGFAASAASPVAAVAQTEDCLSINFESFSAGTIITNQISGVTISATGGSGDAMIFDSANPTGGDKDLGSPHEDFGGPGEGPGGEQGNPGANSMALGNILIISENGDSSDPDDNAGGGQLIFEFDVPYDVAGVEILDVDNVEVAGTIQAFDANNNLLKTANITALGDNAYQIVPVNQVDVSRLVVNLPGSGAVAGITCTPPPPRYNLGNFIWNDLNRNGIQDAGEPGIPGVELELFVAGETFLVQEATTDANGFYVFTGLLDGNYEVEIVGGIPAGFVPTLPNVGNNEAVDSDFVNGVAPGTIAGADNATVDGGFFLPVAGLGDFVWEDLNENGLQDQDEPGVEGVIVNLLNPDGSPVLDDNNDPISTTTDANGAYEFTGLEPGDYKVVFFNLPNGFEFTTPDAGDDALDSDVNPTNGETPVVTLAAGEFNETLDAGIVAPPTGSITIRKNVDDNAFADMMFDFEGDLGEFSLSENGAPFVVTGLAAGNYTITEIVPADWDLTTIDCGGPNNNLGATDGITIVLEAGEDADCTFENEYIPPTGSITIRKNVDDDTFADMMFDFEGDLGEFSLSENGAPFVAMDLPAGNYTITEIVPENWDLTTIDCGGPNNNLGATDGITIVLEAGEDADCTFRNVYIPPPDTFELRMIKYNDLDGDGTNNEVNTAVGSGLSGNALIGWEFVVYDSQGNEVDRNTTSVENAGANGDLGIRASFPGLISGETYTICETQQTGWVNTQPGTINPTYGQPCETVTLTSSSTVVRYFGNQQTTGSITIEKVVVYNADIDTDSGQDFGFFSTELGNFSLDDPAIDDGDSVTNTVTFSNLTAGSYTISEGPDGNWTQTVECVGDSGVTYLSPDTGATINLDGGENVTCTFTNTRNTVDLTYTKVLASGTSAPATPWEFTLASLSSLGPVPVVDQDFGVVATIPAAGGSQTLTVPAGEGYLIGENVPAGYVLESIVCSDGGQITNPADDNFVILPTENLTCTFTNAQLPPPTGSLTVEKVVDWNGFPVPGTPPSFDIVVDSDLLDEPIVLTFPQNDATPYSETLEDLEAGTYTVTEPTVPANFTPSGEGPVEVVGGQTVTATITNTHAEFSSLRLTSDCPAGVFRVTNNNAYPVDYTWNTAGDATMRGPFTAAPGATFGAIDTRPSTSETVRLFVNGVQQDVKATKNPADCVGNVEVTKQVDWNGFPVPATAPDFEICLTGVDANQAEVYNECRTVAAGESTLFSNLEVDGITYSVSEPNIPANFTATGGIGEIAVTKGQTAQVTVTNTHAEFSSLRLTSDCPSGTFRVTNNNTYPVDYTWDVAGSGINGSGTAQPGSNFGAIETGQTSGTVRLFVNGVQQDVKATKPPADCVGNVEVTKEVDWNGFPVPATAPDFEICLTGVDANQAQVYNECRTVAAGESTLFENLEVDGITYSVSEPNIPANFTATGGIGEIAVTKGQTAQVTVTNTHAEFSSLRLTSDCPSGTFRVTNNNTYPVDYTWDVAGSGINGSGTAQPGSNFGAIETGQTSGTVRLFVNGVQQDVKATKPPADCVGNVEVTKEVDWNGFPVPATAPDFEICLTGVDANQAEVYNECRTVAAGHSTLFENLEVDGITYSVSEPNPPANFTPTSGIGHVTVNKGQTAQVTVTNTHAEFSRLRLTSDCPSGTFRVTNNNTYPVDYTWDVAGSGINGSGTAQPGSNFGAIETGQTSGTVRLFVNGVQQDVKATKPPADCVGNVEVTKQVDWNGFPVPDTAPDFEICLTGVDANQAEVYNECRTVAAGHSTLFENLEVDGITYSVSEPNIPANFTATGGIGEIAVNKGQTAQVTVTNTHAEFSRLRLTSDCPSGTFRVTNNNTYPVDYTWDVAGSGINGSGTAQPGSNFGAIETGQTSGTVRLFVNGVQQDVKATKPPADCVGNVEVTKHIDWNGSPELEIVPDFEICLTGVDGNGNNVYHECRTVAAGHSALFENLEVDGITYSVSEPNPPANFTPTSGIGHVTVNKGQTAHVTVVNTYEPPAPTTGSIHVTKEVHWNGVTPDGSQFTLCVDSDLLDAPHCQTVGDGHTADFTDLPLGTYYVYELDPGPMWMASGATHVTISAEHTSASVTITNVRVTLHPLTLTPVCPAGDVTVHNPNDTDVPFHYNNASYVAPANGSITITAHPDEHISITFAGGSASTTALTEADCGGEITPEPTLGCPANYTLVGEFSDILGLPWEHPLGVLQRDYGFNLDEGDYNIAIVAASGVGHPELGCFAGPNNDAGAPCDQGQMHEAFNIAINGGNVAFIQDHGEDQWQSFGTVYTGQISGGSNTVSFIHVGTGDTPESVTFKALVCVQPVEEEEETEPEVTEPEVTEPEVTEPEVTEPEVTEPAVTEPEVTPEVIEPEGNGEGNEENNEEESGDEEGSLPPGSENEDEGEEGDIEDAS